MNAACLQAASFYEKLDSSQKLLWLKLLHYSPLDEDGESLADGEYFFIDPNGKRDPKAELEATIKAFNDTSLTFGKGKLRAACAFPSRRIFLEQNQLIPRKDRSCPDWERWLAEINPESMSLVFSDAYPNNPASMFGHTFLRFNKKGKTNDLLDYGASYEAITDPTDNAIVYTFKGLFGGYPGLFDVHPYYKKVNSYSNSEGRNLWEYPLKLNEKQVRFILSHIWELYNTTYFDYYFLDENCSYHLLELIQIITDEIFETPHRWFYLPRDIVIELYRKNLLYEPDFRPSLREKFKQYYASLNKVDQQQVKRAYENKESNLSTEQLDALILLYQLDRYRNEGELEAEDQKHFTKLLSQRSKEKTPKKKIDYVPGNNIPHTGHGTERVQLGISYTYDQPTTHLSYRSGYHGLSESDLGYSPFSEFTFLGGMFSYFHDDQKLGYDYLNLITVTSLHPWSFYYSQLSWRASVVSEELMETKALNDHATEGDFHLGLSFGNEQIISSLLLGGRVRYSHHFKNHLEAGPSIDFIFGYNFENKFKFILEINYYADLVIDFDQHRATINPIVSWQIHESVELELFYKLLTRYNRDKMGLKLGYSF